MKTMKTTEYKLSKKLKELGVEQEGVFYWDKGCYNITTCPDYYSEWWSAFTLDQILDRLPATLKSEDKEYHLIIEKDPYNKEETEYAVSYEGTKPYQQLAWADHENPAEAAGLLLAECIEKGYIKLGAK